MSAAAPPGRPILAGRECCAPYLNSRRHEGAGGLVVLRCTRELFSRVGASSVGNPPGSFSVLGDWYAKT
jgi:hypothetical protein